MSIIDNLYRRIKLILYCRLLRKHAPKVLVGIETGLLNEPDEPEREVKIRMLRIACKRCDQTLGLFPKGIVYDPKYDEGVAEGE